MTDQLAKVKDMPRSWSQLSQMTECGYQYYLERVAKVWSRPAAWFPMGTAVHHAAEQWEKSGRSASRAEVDAWFCAEYDRDVSEYLTTSPAAESWSSSGRYRGPEDIERRYAVGREHAQRYVDYYEEHTDQVLWIDDRGNPAAELAFNIDLDGVRVRGFIDALVDVPELGVIPVDTKAGTSTPDPGQLKVYEVVRDVVVGEGRPFGAFLTTKNGKMKVHDLSGTSRQEVVDRFGDLDRRVKAEEFDPNPGDRCFRCGVKDSCEYRQGTR